MSSVFPVVPVIAPNADAERGCNEETTEEVNAPRQKSDETMGEKAYANNYDHKLWYSDSQI